MKQASLLLALAASALLAGCVQIQAPDKPIEINLNVNIKQEVVLILKKARQPITDCYVDLTADRATTDPKVFTNIHFHFVVTGKGLDPAKVERAIKLSADVYCSASAMLAKTARVTHDFEIIDA